jgi:hypothetical protein
MPRPRPRSRRVRQAATSIYFTCLPCLSGSHAKPCACLLHTTDGRHAHAGRHRNCGLSCVVAAPPAACLPSPTAGVAIISSNLSRGAFRRPQVRFVARLVTRIVFSLFCFRFTPLRFQGALLAHSSFSQWKECYQQGAYTQ